MALRHEWRLPDITNPWLEWFRGCLDRAIDGAEHLLAGIFHKAHFATADIQ